jgi:hypothetical protein
LLIVDRTLCFIVRNLPMATACHPFNTESDYCASP